MGLVLSSIYSKGDLIVSEVSIKNHSSDDILVIENARNQWDSVHQRGENIAIKLEGSIITLSVEFKKSEEWYSKLFPIFINNVMAGETKDMNYDYDDEDSRDEE